MINRKFIEERLSQVIYPNFTKSIIAFGFVKDILIDKTKVTITIEIPSADRTIKAELAQEIKKEYPLKRR